jgi:pimeloyl-ACP methyl ester carboxylesterase
MAVATTACRPTSSFYKVPDELPAQPGDVVRTTPVMLGKDTTVRGTAVMYRSTGANGEPIVVTGTVLIPRAAWAGPGPRPIVGFAPGTQGFGDRCAPSRTLADGTNYELANVKKLLDQGWVVAETDYQNMGTPGDPTYIVKDAEAHAVLDMVRAAQRIPSTGVTTTSPVGLIGYSQGGQAVAAAAEIEADYAPELAIEGVVAGGVPSDLSVVSANLDGTGPGNQFFTFLALASVGLDTAYDDIDLPAYLNDEGQALLAEARARQLCLFDGLPFLANRHIAELTTGDPLHQPEWQARMADQKLGTVAPAVPALVYHGEIDQVIPFQLGTQLRDDWCARGATVQFVPYPRVDHVVGINAGIGDGIAFLTDRFAGVAPSSSCAP